MAIDPVVGLDNRIGPEDRHRFPTALRGYDKIDVDECLARLAVTVRDLHRRLQTPRDRPFRRREESGPARFEPEPPGTSAVPEPDAPGESGCPGDDNGFGARIEKIMLLARREADEIRAGATREAEAIAGKAKAEAARQSAELARRGEQAEAEIAKLRSRAQEEITRERAEAAARARAACGSSRSKPGRWMRELAGPADGPAGPACGSPRLRREQPSRARQPRRRNAAGKAGRTPDRPVGDSAGPPMTAGRFKGER